MITETFYGACGVEGCAECRPLFDQDDNPIPGTDTPLYCTACEQPVAALRRLDGDSGEDVPGYFHVVNGLGCTDLQVTP